MSGLWPDVQTAQRFSTLTCLRNLTKSEADQLLWNISIFFWNTFDIVTCTNIEHGSPKTSSRELPGKVFLRFPFGGAGLLSCATNQHWSWSWVVEALNHRLDISALLFQHGEMSWWFLKAKLSVVGWNWIGTVYYVAYTNSNHDLPLKPFLPISQIRSWKYLIR